MPDYKLRVRAQHIDMHNYTYLHNNISQLLSLHQLLLWMEELDALHSHQVSLGVYTMHNCYYSLQGQLVTRYDIDAVQPNSQLFQDNKT